MFQLWWSLPVFMTLFTTDKAAKKPISYLSTKMWVVSSKMAIKTFFKNAWHTGSSRKKDGFSDKRNTKSKIQLMHLHWFLGTNLTSKPLPLSNMYCMNVLKKLFSLVKQNVINRFLALKMETYLSKLNAWNI